MNPPPSFRRPALAPRVLSALLIFIAVPLGHAADMVVDQPDDLAGSGTTLRAAIGALTSTGGSVDFVGAAATGTNILASQITLTTNLYTLNPGGMRHVTISTSGSRIFSIGSPDLNLALSSITLSGGRVAGTNDYGGAILAGGSINITLLGTGTFAVENNYAGRGGGAFSSSKNISLAGSGGAILINSNSSGNNGGAFYSGTNIHLQAGTTDTLTISNNYATASGGALYSSLGGDIRLSGTHKNILITSNTAGTYGGAFYANGSNITIDAVTTGTLTISNNQATGYAGGAFYAGGEIRLSGTHDTVVITSNTSLTRPGGAFQASSITIDAVTVNGIHFTNNHAGDGTNANSRGGALFISAAGTGTITLTANGGDITFSGNTQGSARTPNAINAINSSTITLALGGDADIHFHDPIIAQGIDNTLKKTGAGAVIFDGATPSTWQGAASVDAGALRVGDGALLDTTAAGAAFALAPGATLGTATTRGSGTIKAAAFTLAGNLRAAAGSTLVLAGPATLANATIDAELLDDNQSGLVKITGATTFTGTSRVNVQAIRSGTFDVFQAGSAIGADDFESAMYYGGNLLGDDLSGARVFGAVKPSAADNKILQVVAGVGDSMTVDWTGGGDGANWNLAGADWKNTAGGAGAPGVTTAIGDIVRFGDGVDAGKRRIAIGGDYVAVSGMIVDSADDYTFTGDAAIRAETGNAIGDAVAATGRLEKKGAGVLAFQNASNFFEQGIDLDAGVLAFENIGQINTNHTGIRVRGDAGLRVDADTDFDLTENIILSNNATLALAVAEGRQLALAGAFSGAGTVALSGQFTAPRAAALSAAAGAINWTLNPGARLRFAGNPAIGHLRNNGAIEFTAINQTLTATGLSSAADGGAGVIRMTVDLAEKNAPWLVINGDAEGAHHFELTKTGGDPDMFNPRAVEITLATIRGNNTATFTSDKVTDSIGMNAYAARATDAHTVSLVYAGNSPAADAILSSAGVLGTDWHYSLENLRLRLGELRSLPAAAGGAGAGAAGGARSGNFWLRGGAYHIDADAELTGVAFAQDTYGLTAGLDRALGGGAANTFYIGGFITMSRSDRDHDTVGTSRTDDYGAGVYATWLHRAGWYADFAARADGYESKIDVRSTGGTLNHGDYNSYAFGLSLELGRRVMLARRLWLEPSVQAAAAWLNGDDYQVSDTLGGGMRVYIESATAKQYRAQLRTGLDAGRWRPHAKLGGAWSDTDGGGVRTRNGAYHPDFDGWRAEAGAGVAFLLGDSGQIYMDYEYNKAETYKRPWAFNIGYCRLW
jgi:outer membrane autotransporter protein